jgi:hypothetical protein
MKRLAPLYLAFLILAGGRLYADEQLIVRAGTYSDEAMAVSLVLEELGANQVRFSLTYRPKPQTAQLSRAIATQETHGVASPLKTGTGRWAFCFEAPNLVWFYDGMQRVTLWTVTAERGLSRVDSTVEHANVGPSVLREWIRK